MISLYLPCFLFRDCNKKRMAIVLYTKQPLSISFIVLPNYLLTRFDVVVGVRFSMTTGKMEYASICQKIYTNMILAPYIDSHVMTHVNSRIIVFELLKSLGCNFTSSSEKKMGNSIVVNCYCEN